MLQTVYGADLGHFFPLKLVFLSPSFSRQFGHRLSDHISPCSFHFTFPIISWKCHSHHMSARSFRPPLLIGTLSDCMSRVCLKGLTFLPEGQITCRKCLTDLAAPKLCRGDWRRESSETGRAGKAYASGRGSSDATPDGHPGPKQSPRHVR
jgi:hypothetical protein